MKKIKYLLLIVLLTGCTNYKELNSIAITTAISVDYDNINNEYNTLVQVVNTLPKQDISSSNEPNFLNFYSNASSLTETINKIVLESPKKLYTNQTQLLILSEEIIKNHLDEVLDYFIRNPDIRGEMKVVLAPNKEDLKGITIQTLLDSLSSSNIVSSMEESEKEGYIMCTTLNDLLDMYLNPYKEIVLPTIYVEGNINEANKEENITSTIYKGTVKVGNTAIFKDNNIIKYLSFDEEKYLNIIKGKLKMTSLKYNYKDGYIVFDLYNIKSKIIPDIKNNKVTLSIEGKAKSYETITNNAIESTDKVKVIQNFLNKEIKNNITNIFNDIKDNYNTDVFNFRDSFYKSNPTYFKKNDNNWYEEVFPNLELIVESDIHLYEKGKIKEEIKYVKENR